MAITFVGVNSTASVASTIVLAQNADTLIGDLLVVAIEVESGVSNLTAPGGWNTLTTVDQGGNQGVAVYWRTADVNGASNHTWNTTGKKTSGGIITLRGQATSNPVNVGETATNSGTTGNMVANSVTSTVANSWLLAFFGAKKASSVHTTPTDMTNRFTTAASDFRSSGNTQEIASTGATGTRTSGTSDGDSWASVSVLVRPEAEAPPPPPPPASGSRVYYYQESTGLSTTTSNTDQTKVTLTFTPNANKKYVYIWSGQIQASSTSFDVIVNLKKDGTIIAQGNIEDKDVNDFHPVSGIVVEEFGGSPSSVTLTLNFRSESNNTGEIREARIIALELTDNDAYVANTADQTNTTTTFSTAVTLNWTPASAGDYVLVGSTEYRFSANGEVITKIVHASTDYGITTSRRQDTTNYHPGLHTVYLSNLSGAQTATIQWARSATATGTANSRNAHLLALRVSDFPGAWESNSRTRATTTSNALQTATDTGATTVNALAPVLILGAAVRDHNSTSNFAITTLSENSTDIITATSQESVIASATIDLPAGMWGQMVVKNPAADNASYQLRYRSSANGTSTGISDSQIVVLQLESLAPPALSSGNFFLMF